VNLVISLAGGEMKEERSDRIAVRPREPVEVFSYEVMKSRQNDPAHPVELRDENDLRAISRSGTKNRKSC
jgi:hypothetical protein